MDHDPEFLLRLVRLGSDKAAVCTTCGSQFSQELADLAESGLRSWPVECSGGLSLAWAEHGIESIQVFCSPPCLLAWLRPNKFPSLVKVAGPGVCAWRKCEEANQDEWILMGAPWAPIPHFCSPYCVRSFLHLHFARVKQQLECSRWYLRWYEDALKEARKRPHAEPSPSLKKESA